MGNLSYCPNLRSGRLRSNLTRVEAARVDQLSVAVAQLVRWFLLSLPLCTDIVAITDIASLSFVVFQSPASATSASHPMLLSAF